MTDTSPSSAEMYRPKRAAHVLEAEFDGELALYDPLHQELLILNHTARAIWSCCDGIGTVGEIAADIAGVYEVELEEVRAQMDGLLGDWQRRELLETPVHSEGAVTSLPEL